MIARARRIGISVFVGWLTILTGAPSNSLAGTVRLRDGTVYRGEVARDNTIYTVFDGVKRIILRDNRIATTQSDNYINEFERIKVDQPLEVHAGQMPVFAIGVNAGPWDEQGRRMFSFHGQIGKTGTPRTYSMSQAINEIGADHVHIRGITGFWQGRLALDQVPRKTILSLLSTVDSKDLNMRLSVIKLLIQAEWYADADAALVSIAKDFPDQEEKVATIRKSIKEWSAANELRAIRVRVKARQYRGALSRLKTFPTAGAAASDVAEVRDLIQKLDKDFAADRALGDAIRKLDDGLPEAEASFWRVPMVEVLKGLSEAGDSVRDRLAAYEKAAADPNITPDVKLALAMSGWIVGADYAVPKQTTARNLWKARDLVRDYLRTTSESKHAEILDELRDIDLAGVGGSAVSIVDVYTRIVELSQPPRADAKTTDQGVSMSRVLDDDNPVPTEYAVLLPPEYHPLRTYPAIVALHEGKGAVSAIDWWRDQAQKRGYIIIAPEYNLPDRKGVYDYSPNEHGAVTLALRDALKRYSIDADRVFLGGQLTGGDMAWDLGLAHPDRFAGVATVSGGPLKYVFTNRSHAKWLPMYIVVGDLNPFLEEVLFPMVKDMISRYPDVTYVEYYQRGAEDLPEEAPRILDWMDKRKRDPYPKSFDASAARSCDDRFFGVVIDEFQAGRTTAPEAAEPTGKNIHPATIRLRTSALSNLMNFTVSGINRMHVWLSPQIVDFNKKFEVRVNGAPYFKGTARPDLEAFLEDLRIRGDRKQTYWLKVTKAGTGRTRRAATAPNRRPRS